MEEDIYAHLYAKRQKYNKRRREYNIYKIIIFAAIAVIAIASILIYMSNHNLEKEKQNAERIKKEAAELENKEKEKQEQEQKNNQSDQENQGNNQPAETRTISRRTTSN